MSIVTSANLANAILKLVAADALPMLSSQLVIGHLITRTHEPSVAIQGDTVEIAQSDIALDLPIKESFTVPDVTKALAFPELLRAYMLPGIVSIANQIERKLITYLDIGTLYGVRYRDAADLAETRLDRGGKLRGERFYMITGDKSYSKFRQLPHFSEFYSAGEAGLNAPVEGNVGKIGNCFVFRVHGLPSDPDFAIAFTKRAIGMATRRIQQPLPGTGKISEYSEIGTLGIRAAMQYKPSQLAQELEISVLFGAGVLDPSQIVRLNLMDSESVPTVDGSARHEIEPRHRSIEAFEQVIEERLENGWTNGADVRFIWDHFKKSRERITELESKLAALQEHATKLEAYTAEYERTKNDTARLLNVARGCHDFGGGYSNGNEAEIFHHGIQTVINSLEAAAREPESMSVKVLERIGAEETPPNETGDDARFDSIEKRLAALEQKIEQSGAGRSERIGQELGQVRDTLTPITKAEPCA